MHHAKLLSRLCVEMLVTGYFTDKVGRFLPPDQDLMPPTRKQSLSRHSSKNSYNTKYSRLLRFLSQKHWSFPWVRASSYVKQRIQ